MDQRQDGRLWSEIRSVAVDFGARGGLGNIVDEIEGQVQRLSLRCCHNGGAARKVLYVVSKPCSCLPPGCSGRDKPRVHESRQSQDLASLIHSDLRYTPDMALVTIDMS